jgi:hypothetical protein
MKTISILAALGVLGLWSPCTIQAGSSGSADKDKNHELEAALSAVPVPEWPAQAVAFVTGIKGAGRENAALAAVTYAAAMHPGSVTPMVSALAGVVPGSAPAIAATAAKLQPAEAPLIQDAAVKAAPTQAEQITHAVAGVVPGSAAVREKDSNSGNRPPVPPGLAGSNKPGLIHGNRPLFPPGLVLDPKPGRDPQRNKYGSP